MNSLVKKTNGKRSNSGVLWFEGVFKLFICILPLALFFSYYPLMHFGQSESMNFEISLPLIWLGLFDLIALILMIKKRLLLRKFGKKWLWLLFPIWVSVSVLWSLNSLRGLLTAGILWMMMFAGYGMWALRKMFDEEFKKRFLRWFLIEALVVCGWCILQCILDIVGVSRDYTLMCQGCTYKSFGFPHPSGFAVEPQFMGNLLLAPLVMLAWIIISKKQHSKNLELEPLLCCFFVIVFTLFLTFSRGAIYAFGVGLMALSVWTLVAERKRIKEVVKKVGLVWLLVVMAFGTALVTQGVMAQVSPTNDTFATGVSKVLNHLSLGVIDIRSGDKQGNTEVEKSQKMVENSVEKPVENFEEESSELNKNEAIFDGYVEESTEVRKKLTSVALEVWSKDFKTVMFGVGIGGAGQALYVNGLMDSPREIVQNQYASLLLETGMIGVFFAGLIIVLAINGLKKSCNRVLIICLMLAYGVTLFFFSGLPNALQVYLMPVLLSAITLAERRRK